MSKVERIAWGHDALAADLARRLRDDGKAWTWLNATIGAWSGRRPDIMAFPRYRYDVPQIHAYEIKVQRSDLQRDLGAEKWRKYLEHCQSVTFAMPHGLATKDELPSECGVMFRTARGWRTERRPTNIGAACSIQAMAKRLTCHPSREPYPGLHKYEQDAQLVQARAQFLRSAGVRYGAALARLAAEVADGNDPAEAARTKANELLANARAEADDIRKELSEMLGEFGLSSNADAWAVRQHMKKMRDTINVDARHQKVQRALEAMEQALIDARGFLCSTSSSGGVEA